MNDGGQPDNHILANMTGAKLVAEYVVQLVYSLIFLLILAQSLTL